MRRTPTTRSGHARRAAGAGSVCAGAVLLAAACAGPGGPVDTDIDLTATTDAPAGGLDSVTWMLPKEPETLDLDEKSDTAQNTVMANVCERLMELQPDLTTTPRLAEDVEWSGEKTVVLTLRRDVRFHDGSPMDADDVVWSMRRHSREESDESDEYANVESVERTGKYEVTVRMSQRDAVFVQAMAGNGGIVYNRRVIERVEDRGDTFGAPGSPDACSGPYRIDAWRSGSQVALARAEDYWDRDRAAHARRVTFRWAEENAVVNTLTTGESDGAYLDTASAAIPLLRDNATRVFQGPATNVWSLIPTERGGLSDPRLRRALSLALEREGVTKAAFGGLARPWSTPVGPGAWGYETNRFEHAHESLRGAPADPGDADLAAARRLVDEAGAPEKPLVVASDGEPARTVIASAVVDAAAKIGVEAEITTIPRQQFASFYTDPDLRGTVDMFPDEYYISKNDPVGFYKNGATDADVNYAGFADGDYDDLIEEAQATADDADRAELSIELERRWTRRMVWIPVAQVPTTLAMSRYVTGAPSSAAFLYYPWAADLGSASQEGGA